MAELREFRLIVGDGINPISETSPNRIVPYEGKEITIEL
jgi:hypothetical protein